ncbi:MAG: hypothetical protein ACRD5F_15330 [Candidatus Acidiferrales bacterium]
MSRPAAVVVTTVLLTLGGLLCAAMAALMVLSLAIAPPETPAAQANPAMMRFAMFFVVAFFGLIGLWQLGTAFGVWKLKPWGRVSLVVFAGLLVTFQAIGMLMVFFLPMPTDVAGAADFMLAVRVFLFAFYALTAGIGVWWLVYFTRPGVKALFSPDGVVPPESPRPLSIVIIGWLLATTALLWPLAIYWQWPAILFWKVFTGWGAVAINTVWCAVTLYAGIGLLRWRMNGYYAAIGFYAFGAVNTLVFYLLPGVAERTREMIAAMPFLLADSAAAEAASPPLLLSALMGFAGIGVPLYFLLTRKAKFIAMSKSRQASSA